MARDKRPDWNAIKAEYIASGKSYRKLSQEYGISKDIIARQAKAEDWPGLRDKARDKATTEVIQRTADAVATNAAKLEQARGIAIDKLLAILSRYPEDAGSKVRISGKTQRGESQTNDFGILDLVTALEKLSRGGMAEADYDPLLDRLNAQIDAEINA